MNWDLGGGNHPAPEALHLFQYRFTWEQNVFEIYSQKDVEVISPEAYGSVSEKCARKKYGFWKTHEGGYHPPR